MFTIAEEVSDEYAGTETPHPMLEAPCTESS
jgi:hypothetical protein